MCECFGGDPVEFENLRSPEQQAMMQGLYHALLTGGQQGATQFPGQLNAPMVDAQKMAMKTMSGIGGYGWEQQKPQYKPVESQFNPTNTWDLPVRGGGNGGGGNSPTPPGPTPPGPTPPGPVPPEPVPPGPTPPGPVPPGPGPEPHPGPMPMELMQMLMAMGMGGSPYDPRNPMG